tara:strand:- start:9732 stop:10055 length:324 start_codon:yes stop_codon:yes gene_type:complete
MMKLVPLIVLILISLNTHSNDVDIFSSRVGVVDEIYGLIIPDNDIINKPDCANSNILVWDKTTEHGKILMSIALAGHAASKKMLVGFDSGSCLNNGRLSLKKIHIYK